MEDYVGGVQIMHLGAINGIIANFYSVFKFKLEQRPGS
jgi:hypothetical protein